jgi:hypothetical protein
MENWYQKLFGIKEVIDYSNSVAQNKSYLYNKLNFTVGELDGSKTITSNANNTTYFVGTFNNDLVLSLKSECEYIKSSSPDLSGKPTFKCIAVKNIFLEHSKEENRGALFQAASQFNSLEFGSQYATPEEGVTIYEDDPTQGPNCALPTAPGTVYRNYFAPIKCSDGNEQIGQTANCQFNNLDGIEAILYTRFNKKFFTVKNGYVDAREDQLIELNQNLSDYPKLKGELQNALKVGFHRNLQVVFRNRWELLNDPTFLVSQVYASALSIGYSKVKTKKLWYPLAEIVLNATYEAIVYAGYINLKKNKNPKVHLTLVGGGVFGNPPELIAGAIDRAINIAIENNFPLEIYCGFYRNLPTEKIWTDLCEKYTYLDQSPDPSSAKLISPTDIHKLTKLIYNKIKLEYKQKYPNLTDIQFNQILIKAIDISIEKKQKIPLDKVGSLVSGERTVILENEDDERWFEYKGAGSWGGRWKVLQDVDPSVISVREIDRGSTNPDPMPPPGAPSSITRVIFKAVNYEKLKLNPQVFILGWKRRHDSKITDHVKIELKGK